MNIFERFAIRLTVIVLLASCTGVPDASAQNSSLFHLPAPQAVPPAPPPAVGNDPMTSTVLPPAITHSDRPNVMLNGASWMFQPPPPLRTFRKDDIVTIRVDEIARMMAEGEAENRKQTLYEAILTDWIRITDFRLRPDPQANGDPAISGESINRFRSESSVESREAMSFNIAATVVDIRPNGSLVLEARKTIRVNDNLWETSLFGICRAQDIAPDNVVLSKDVIDLEIRKEDRGHLRDGYRRGWFSRWFDRVQPF